MATNEKKILQIFKRDLANSEPNKKLWAEKILQWNKEFNGEPYGNEDPKKKKASVVSRDIKRSAAAQHASVIDPFVSNDNIIKCSPVTHSDVETSRQSELLLNFQFCRDFDRYNFVSDSFKVMQREGTVIARVSWEFEEEEQLVDVPVMGLVPVTDPQERQQMQMQGLPPYKQGQVGVTQEWQMVTTINRPRVELVRNSMLWIDPTAEGNIDDAKFVVYKYKSSLSQLRKEEYKYKNLDNIMVNGEQIWDEDSPYYRDDTFTFSDKPRQELEVVEYWGYYDMDEDGIAEPIVCTWVGDTIIRLEENPYPDKKLPFVSCAYDSMPYSIYGVSHGDTISTDQKIKTGIKRAILDTLAASTNGQRGVKKGTLDIANKRKFDRGENFEYLGSNQDMWEGRFNAIPNDVLNFYNLVDQEIQTLSGTRPSGPTSGSSSMDSKRVTDGMDSAARRETDISRNFKENFLVPILRKWYSMDAEWMEEDQIIRITDTEFIAIKPDDLQGRIDISMDISTREVENEKSNNLSFMLQTMAQSLPFDLTKILLAEQASLKGMPDLAKKIEEFQPQPDPMQQQMQQLEMQKLQSEINERNSRVGENQVDSRLKSAKAVNEEAKARKAHSDADMVDLDFLRKQDGQDLKEEMFKSGVDNRRKDVDAKNQALLKAQEETLKYMGQKAINDAMPKEKASSNK